MSENDPLHSSRYSIDHAKRHIGELERQIEAFYASQAYAQVAEPDTSGVYDILKIKLVKPFPAPIAGLAFDAANSLRSALDQAGFAIAIAAGASGKHAHFPFGETAGEVESRHRRQSRDLPKEVFELMASYQPHKGGNFPLWALNRLCNGHKHQTVTTMVAHVGNAHAEVMEFSGDMEFPPRWDRRKKEMVVAKLLRGTKANIKATFALHVTFGEIDALAGEAPGPFLGKIADEVGGIIDAIDAKARSLGLFA